MSGIEVREWKKGGVLVELKGEFDRHDLKALRGALSDVVALRQPTLVDLTGVTFLDVGAIRELAIQSQLYAHHLTLNNPSWQVQASARACGLEAWLDFRAGADAAVTALSGLMPVRKLPLENTA